VSGQNVAAVTQQFTFTFILPGAPGSIGLDAGDLLSIEPVDGATMTNANIAINDIEVASAPTGTVSYLVPSDISGFPQVKAAFDFSVGPGQRFTVSCVHVDTADALTALAAKVTGVGPGKSLANKVAQASASLAANDIPSTCSTMQGFINEVKAQTGKKIAPTLAASLISDAQAIRTALGC
jgi:hypothetical protein